MGCAEWRLKVADTQVMSDPPEDQAPGGPLGRDYRLLWVASSVSNLGDGIFLVALPLLAASITRSPARLSLVVLAGRLPWLLFALISGALVDRWDRRRVMWVVDAVRFLVVAGLASAVAADAVSIWLLVVVSFLGDVRVPRGVRTDRHHRRRAGGAHRARISRRRRLNRRPILTGRTTGRAARGRRAASRAGRS